MYIYMRIYIHPQIYVYIYIHIYTYTYIYAHTHMYTSRMMCRLRISHKIFIHELSMNPYDVDFMYESRTSLSRRCDGAIRMLSTSYMSHIIQSVSFWFYMGHNLILVTNWSKIRMLLIWYISHILRIITTSLLESRTNPSHKRSMDPYDFDFIYELQIDMGHEPIWVTN